jgi:hypothetical protein
MWENWTKLIITLYHSRQHIWVERSTPEMCERKKPKQNSETFSIRVGDRCSQVESSEVKKTQRLFSTLIFEANPNRKTCCRPFTDNCYCCTVYTFFPFFSALKLHYLQKRIRYLTWILSSIIELFHLFGQYLWLNFLKTQLSF